MVTPLVFDGHNDVLSKLAHAPAGTELKRLRRDPTRAIDLARARAGGFAGGLFAVWIPSPSAIAADYAAMSATRFNIPLPPPVPLQSAKPVADRQVAILSEAAASGDVALCRSATDIRTAMASRTMAAVLHMEGAEAIDPDLEALEAYHAAGLRSLGPVWSRPNRFGHGVPFRFPSSPDTGPGLTADGERLIRRCSQLGIVVDVAHLTEKGFWDVARLLEGPFVASHSNVHALCPTARNLTDKQLAAIAERGGLVGVNFATAFLRADGRMLADVPLETILVHLDHLLERLGEEGVAFGSDYDGAVVPEAIASVDALPRLTEAMAAHGYGDELIAKISHRNWIAVLERIWGL